MNSSLLMESKADKYLSLVKNLGAACFLLMFQAYLIAPLLPDLAHEFHSSLTNQAIPAFAIPYGISALCSIPLGNSIGKTVILQWSIWLMTLGCFAIASCHGVVSFLFVRILMGIATGGILPLTLVIIAERYPASVRGARMVIIVFSMALGMTLGPVIGGYFDAVIGWRAMYLIVGALSLVVYLRIILNRFHLPPKVIRKPENIRFMWHFGQKILRHGSGPYLFMFIFLGGVFHSGVFVWISAYFTTHYHLNDQGIALALLDFGFPGLLMVMLMTAFSVKTSSKNSLLTGLGLVAVCVALLWINLPLWLAYFFVVVLSVGFNITQPLFIGITKTLHNGPVSNLAIGLGCGILFIGYGTGPMLFMFLLSFGDFPAIIFLSLLVLSLSILALKVWNEKIKTIKHGLKRQEFYFENRKRT